MNIHPRACLLGLLLLALLLPADGLGPALQAQAANYDLLILTPDAFDRALQPLVDHKNATGMATHLLTLTEVYRDFAGVDAPEQIKRAIEHYERDHQVRYVMLVGDVNVFPVRWQYGHLVDHLIDDPTKADDQIYVAADFYYADLYDASARFNRWDANGNGRYGEIYRADLNPDGIDPFPDVAVARVPAADVTQVQTYVAKVIRYEYSAHGAPWFQRLLLIQREFSTHVASKEVVAGRLSAFTPVRLYAEIAATDYGGVTDSVPTAANINLALNTGAGLLSELSHGEVTHWYSDANGLFYDISDIQSAPLGLTGGRSNTGRLPVIYSGACVTAIFYGQNIPYRDYVGTDGITYTSPGGPGSVGATPYPAPDPLQTGLHPLGLGEAFVVENEHGAIAYLGSLDTGEPGYHRVLEEAFFEAYGRGDTVLGDMWTYAVETFAGEYNLRGLTANNAWTNICLLHTPSRYILFGDPSLRVGGLADVADLDPPETSLDRPGLWQSDIRLVAVDRGAPPSGVRQTFWQAGSHSGTGGVVVQADGRQLPDGAYTLAFHSEDFLDNVEVTRTVAISVDTVPPTTTILLDGEPPATTFCPAGTDCLTAGCFTDKVQITLDAWDNLSGVARTEYTLGGSVQSYTDPFVLPGGDFFDPFRIRYWSTDQAGNGERPHSLRFCISNARAGFLRDEARIMDALKQIVAMRMRQAFADSLPPIKGVRFEYKPAASQAWSLIGVDATGADGWGTTWDTRQAADGLFDLRTTVFGFPPPGSGAASSAIIVDPILYQETLQAAVVNLPDSAYTFTLAAPATLGGGETAEYTVTFTNQQVSTLKQLVLTCDLDTGFFDQLQVEDGGAIDTEGLPTWSRFALEDGHTWQVHFRGMVRGDAPPGETIGSQCLLQATGVPQLLSDNPATPPRGDATDVTLRLLKGSIGGVVLDQADGAPLVATVSVAGAQSYQTTTDASGAYSVTNLPADDYTVSVAATAYAYYSPAGPVQITLDGSGQPVARNFYLAQVDTRPPFCISDTPVDALVQGSQQMLSGIAHDPADGSGVKAVGLRIHSETSGTDWDGSRWSPETHWLPAIGTTAWHYDMAGVAWNPQHAYTIWLRATDHAGNSEAPHALATTPAVPHLLSPANGTTVSDRTPSFDWSDVPGATYLLQVDDQADFSTPESGPPDAVNASHYTPGAALAVDTYHWRVRAVSAGGRQGAWSEVWTLTIPSPVRELFLPRVDAP